VNTQSPDAKKEFLIVQQRATSEHDCIAHAFLTHEHLETSKEIEARKKMEEEEKQERKHEKEGQEKKEIIKPKCTDKASCEEHPLFALKLHYFERFFDAQHRLKACTYNTFDLTGDFLNMI